MTENTAAKAERNQLNLPQKYDLMTLIKVEYPKKGMTDSEFAKAASEQLGFAVTGPMVKHYREAFGIEQTKAASAAELKARIAELEAALAAKAAA